MGLKGFKNHTMLACWNSEFYSSETKELVSFSENPPETLRVLKKVIYMMLRFILLFIISIGLPLLVLPLGLRFIKLSFAEKKDLPIFKKSTKMPNYGNCKL